MYSDELSTSGGVWRSVAGIWLGVVYVATADHRTADGDIWHGVVLEQSGECSVAVVVDDVVSQCEQYGIDVVRPAQAICYTGWSA